MPQVHKATSVDVKDAANTIVKAFIHDPFNAYFYNLMPDPGKPPHGTEEMMAHHIRNELLTELVLVADDGEKKSAAVALWEPPRPKSIGWFKWTIKTLHKAYTGFLGLLYYRNRGVNRKVGIRQFLPNYSDFANFERSRRKSWTEFLETIGRKILITCIF
jgi:hypothetical protein